MMLMVAIGLRSSPSAADSTEAQAARPTKYQVASDNSILFINGQYVASPYEIEFQAGRLTVNGIRLEVSAPYDSHQPNSKEGNPIPGFQPGFRFSGRRGFGANGPPKWVYFPERVVAGQLRDRLQAVDILIAFDRFPLRTAQVDGNGVAAALLAESEAEFDWDEILRPTESADEAAAWQQWLGSYQIPVTAKDRLLESISAAQKIDAQALAATAGIVRLDRYAYPLTVLGMLLGVFALGHMLQWAGNGLHQQDSSEESERYVILALGMMAGMASLDFLWTVLAGQAGQMKEVNPLAASFIDTPAQLAIFKIVATGIGFAILYFWRQRHQIQKVAWWMCLVCVLLTFRWVMFDSMRA